MASGPPTFSKAIILYEMVQLVTITCQDQGTYHNKWVLETKSISCTGQIYVNM